MAIRFQGDVPKELKERKMLKFYIKSIFGDFDKTAGSITFSFTNDEAILEVNKTYLFHDYYTDIITFDLSTVSHRIDADILISYETVQSNAIKFEVPFSKELHRVIFHGILHLCGLDDKMKTSQLKMSKAEDFYLQKYFG